MSSRLYRINFEEIAPAVKFDAGLLANRVCVCVRHLQRHFRDRYNESPQLWLDEQRLKTARELLLQGKRPKEVAFELGFKQLSHFSRVYRERFGQCPTETLAAFAIKGRSRVNESGCRLYQVRKNRVNAVSP